MMQADTERNEPALTVDLDALVLEKVLALTGRVEAMADAIGELNKVMTRMREEMVTQSELLDVISVNINACVSDDEETDVSFNEDDLGALRTVEVDENYDVTSVDKARQAIDDLNDRVRQLENRVCNLEGLAARVDDLAEKVNRRDAGLLYRSDEEFKPLPDVVKCKCRKPIDEGEL